MRPSLFLLAALVSGGLSAGVAPSADQVRPRLIGDAVPDVAVETADGKAVPLRTVTEGDPSIVVFYRGGW